MVIQIPGLDGPVQGADFNDIRDALGAAVESYMLEWIPTVDRFELSDLNVYSYIERTIVPPAAVIMAVPNRSVDYVQMQSSGFATYYFTILVVIGQVDSEAAQRECGVLISPGSPLITAINNVRVGQGYVLVTHGAISTLSGGQSGAALYTHVQYSVMVKA
jgi:hypothetical protein